MADLKEALLTLAPIDSTSLPTTPDDLASFLHHSFQAAEIIAQSVPLPSSTDPEPTLPILPTATSASSMRNTSARIQSLEARHTELQAQWGKPVKIAAKDNPMNVAVYKMAGSDRRGAWFGRRSVHYGIGFKRFKSALESEFEESLAVKAGPGSGAVRGIAGDSRVERRVVEGVGVLEVWQLSSVFPGPVTPREFTTLQLTSDQALSQASVPEVAAGAEAKPPRHFMVVSRPTTHPDAPHRKELVHGQFESVELMRELPIHHPTDSPDAEENPCEWIMVTRSDPGGGIPKFMVERGTPGAIVADVAKFFDWATGRDHTQHTEDVSGKHHGVVGQEVAGGPELQRADGPELPNQTAIPASTVGIEAHDKEAASIPPEQGTNSDSIISSITATVASYIPTSVSSTASTYLPYHSTQETLKSHDRHSPYSHDHSDTSSTISGRSSVGSFASCKEITSPNEGAGSKPDVDSSASADARSAATKPGTQIPTDATTHSSTETTPNPPPASPFPDDPLRPSTPHEKELAKITQKRLSLDAKIAKQRDEEARKALAISQKDEKDRHKATEKHERERRKAEEKFRREAEKLEARRAKEERKVEERRAKAREKDVLGRVARERDEWRGRWDVVEREAEVLRGRVAELEGEVAVLLERVRGLEGKVVEVDGLRGTSAASSVRRMDGRRSKDDAS